MLTAEQKQAFVNDGYFILEETVPKTLVEEIRHEVQMMTEKEPGEVIPGQLEVWNKPAFISQPPCQKIIQRLLQLPTVMEPVQELIGSDIRLLLTDLGVIPSGRGEIYWHRDHIYLPDALLAGTSNLTNSLTDNDFRLLLPVLLGTSVFIIIYLQDTSDTMGAKRVIPTSHRWQDSPDQTYANSLSGEVRLPLPAGAAVFFEPSLWHTMGVNTSTTDYWLLGLTFGKTNIQPLLEALKGKIGVADEKYELLPNRYKKTYLLLFFLGVLGVLAVR